MSAGASLLASLLDGFSLVLLIPFLRALFGQAALDAGSGATPVDRIIAGLVGPFLEGGTGEAAVFTVLIVIVVAMALKNVFSYLASYLSVVIQERVVRDLRRTLYGHIQRLSLSFFQRTRGGQLLARVVADADQARQAVSAALASFIQNLALILVYLAILLGLSWRLTALAVALAPVLAIGIRPIVKRVRRHSRAAADQRGELASLVNETVAGARLVKAHGAEDYERGRFADTTQRVYKGATRAQRFALLASPLSETFGAAVTMVVIAVGTRLVLQGGMGPEALVSFLIVTLRLLSPLKSITQFPALTEGALAASERIFEILDLKPEQDGSGARPCPGLVRELRYENLWYAYEGENWVLEDLSFTARRGEIVAIVGPSGAGKSTLVDLLPRFFDPSRGRITVDGVATTEYTRGSLRRLMGIVSQETVLFNATVRANIAYGSESRHTQDQVEAAARSGNAHEFIAQLPLKYDTILAERGTRLSGGQRQRIAIARALLKDPPILIFDEATSALDSESERQVQEAIDRLLAGRTVFVIAHRLSTVQHAQQILVLDRGRLVEQGTHDVLLAKGGVYRRLYDLQFAPTASASALRP
ncbi:MAG: ABC transporter ATP-binding protein [Gemmatimonadales bacterium]